ncbi:cupin domain-containing protein [Siminovitchia acidinfaciens]|nr:cupin domain-containing protein [Siminovitchia acidinfaciens]
MLKNIAEFQEFNQSRFVRVNLFQEGNTTAFLLNLLPGQSVPPHPHPNANVYLHVVEGEGTFIINEKELPVSQKDVVHCADQEVLQIKNQSDEPLSVYVVMAKS